MKMVASLLEDVIPEMNHNEIVAWGEEKAAENQSLLIFTWDGAHQRNEMRLDWFLDNITVEPAGINV